MNSVFRILDDIHTAIFREGRKAIADMPGFLLRVVHMIEKLFEYENTKRVLGIITIVFLCFISFTKSDHYFATTDALPNNISTLNIIFNNQYDISNVARSLEKKDLEGIYVTNNEGVVYPKTSVFLGIAGVPAYRFMHHIWGVEKLDNESMILSQYSQYFGKFYASFLSAVSAAFMYLILRFQKFPHGRSFGLALVYALCTNVFNIAAQSNIQHAISLFLVTGATTLFFWKPTNRYTLIAAGIIIGMSTQIRISNGFYAVFFGLMMHPSFRKVNISQLKEYFNFVLGFALGYAALLFYLKTNNIPNGYQDEIMFSLEILTPSIFFGNVFALLFSYNYGLFIFSPIFLILISAILLRRKIKSGYSPQAVAALITILIFISFAASWWMWSGGLSLGARLIIEAIPLGILLLAYYYDSFLTIKSFKFQLAILIAISIYFNILTSFSFDKTWHDTYTKPGHESQIRNAWLTKPTLLEYMMQHPMYFDEQLTKNRDTMYVDKKWYWWDVQEMKVLEMKKAKIRILPVPK